MKFKCRGREPLSHTGPSQIVAELSSERGLLAAIGYSVDRGVQTTVASDEDKRGRPRRRRAQSSVEEDSENVSESESESESEG